MLFALGALGGSCALAQAKADWQVKQRQAAMMLQGKYMGPVRNILLGRVPYDASALERNTGYLAALSQMPWDGFTPDSQGEKSRARPEIFKDPARFKAAYEDFQAVAARLAAAARARDQAGARAAFEALQKACGDCHDAFRSR